MLKGIAWMPIAALASFLQSELGVPVTDATGLSGNYNFKVQWTPDERQPNSLGQAPSADQALNPPIRRHSRSISSSTSISWSIFSKPLAVQQFAVLLFLRFVLDRLGHRGSSAGGDGGA